MTKESQENQTNTDKLRLSLLTTVAANDHPVRQLVLGFLRFEALRKLNPRKFAELHKRNLNGENFDGMIDSLIIDSSIDDSI